MNNSTDSLKVTLDALANASQLLQHQWQQLDDERERLNNIAKDLARKKMEIEKSKRDFEEEKEAWFAERNNNNSDKDYKARLEPEIAKLRALKQELDEQKRKFLQEKEDWLNGKRDSSSSVPLAGIPPGSPISDDQSPIEAFSVIKKKLFNLITEFTEEIRKSKEDPTATVNKQYAIGAVKMFVSIQNELLALVRGQGPLESYLAENFTPLVKEVASSVKLAINSNDYSEVEFRINGLREPAVILGDKLKEKEMGPPPPYSENFDEIISTFTPGSASKTASRKSQGSSAASSLTNNSAEKSLGRVSGYTKARVVPRAVEEPIATIVPPPLPQLPPQKLQQQAGDLQNRKTRANSSGGNSKNAVNKDFSNSKEEDAIPSAVEEVIDSISAEVNPQKKSQSNFSKASSTSPVSIHGTMARPKPAQRTKYEYLFGELEKGSASASDSSSGDRKLGITSSGSSPAIPAVPLTPSTSSNSLSVNSKEKWKCGKCTTPNEGSSAKCMMCGEPKSGIGNSPLLKSKDSIIAKEEWKCPRCTSVNPPLTKTCFMCGTQLEEEKEEEDESDKEKRGRPGRSKSAGSVKRKVIPNPKLETKNS